MKPIDEINQSIEKAKQSEAAYQDLRKRFREAYPEERRRQIVLDYAKGKIDAGLFNYDVLEMFFLLRKN